MSHYKTLSKRGLALVLALVMLFTLLPVSALAEEGENGIDPQVETPQDTGINSFEALATAVEGASVAQQTVITLSDSFEATGSISIGYRNIVLDLNGQTVTAMALPLFKVDNEAGSLIIKDDSEAGSGAIVSDAAAYNLVDVSAGKFVLESGSLSVSGNDAIAVSVSNTAAATITGGKISAPEGCTAIVNDSFCTIEGGQIEGKVEVIDNGTTAITGGTFTDKETVNNVLKGSGYVLDETGSLTVDETQDVFAAKVGSKGYKTLQEAIAAALPNDMVELLKDDSLTENVTVGNSITLNLNEKALETNGKTITVSKNAHLSVTGNGTVNCDAADLGDKRGDSLYTMFKVEEGGELTLQNGTYTTKAYEIVYTYGKATVENGTFICSNGYDAKCAMVANGTTAELNIKAGTIEAKSDERPDESQQTTRTFGMYGIYAKSGATVNLGNEETGEGPSITAYEAAVGLDNTTSSPALTIIIYGGVYHVVNDFGMAGSVSPNEKFNTVLYLSGNSTTNIYGGTFIGSECEKGHILSLPYTSKGQEGNHMAANVTLNIQGGSFTTTDSCPVFFVGEGVEPPKCISGGTFSSDVNPYVIEGRQANAGEGVWTIGPATGEGYVATVGGTSYKTLQAAIDTAGEGDTVTLMRPVTENILISGKKDIILNGNGQTITGVEGEHGIQVYCSDNVTLKNVTVTGAGKSGLLVNASSVTVEGNLNLAGNGGDTFWAKVLNVSYGENINGSHPTSLTFAGGTMLSGVETIYSDKADMDRAKEAGTTITISAVPGLVEVKGLEAAPNFWTTEANAKDTAVAETDGTYYTTLKAAINEAKDADTVTLLKDIPNSARVMIKKSLTLDLNGHTIGGGDQFATIMLDNKNAKVEIKNGSLSDVNAARGTVYVQQGEVTLTNVNVTASIRGVGIGPGVKGYYGKATLNAGTTITATESGVGIFGPNDGVTPKSELIVNEGVSITSQLYGIAGNGTNDDTIITINGGTVSATGWTDSATGVTYATAIYHPQQGTLNIKGGTIEGKVGVQMAAGTAVIEGGTLRSTDTEVLESPYKAGNYGDGTVLDGAALSLVSRLAYGDIDVTVTGGTFTAQTGNEAIRKYGMQKAGQTWEVIPEPTTSVLKVSGGTFSTPVEFAHCAENYLPVTKGDAYGVAEGPLELSAEYLPLVVGGETGTLTVVKPANVIGLTWEFDRNVIGFNPETGVVTASGRGEATITAKVGNQSATCTVVVTQPVNSVTLDQETADMMVGGETVTLTATINPVYANEQTIVWTSSNTAIATVDQTGVITAVGAGTATITATVGGKSAECTVTVAPAPVPPGPSGPVGGTTIEDPDVPLASVLPFDDVTEGQWFYDAVAYAYENKLMAGITDNLFDPQGNTTRGMIVTILYRLEGEPAVTGASAFDDVAADQWYTNAVIWGTANKVVAGYGDSTYRPTQNITREELAAILYRYAELKGYDVTVTEGAALNFPDGDEVSEYARPALLWAVEKGLINGMDNGTVSARSGATRAQVATILKGFCEKFVDAE